MATATKSVPLSSLPAGATFHVPFTGHEGTVSYHGAGSSTVSVRKFRVETKARKVKAKKGSEVEVERDVTTAQYEVATTQWSTNTMVVAGPMPQDLREQCEERAKREGGLLDPTRAVPPELAGNPFLADEPAAAPAAAPKKAAPRKLVVAAPATIVPAAWPQEVGVPLGVMHCKNAKGKTYRALCAKHAGLREAGQVKVGAGVTLVYEVASAAGMACLLDNLNNKDGRKTLARLLAKLARAGMDVQVRGAAYVVEGQVA